MNLQETRFRLLVMALASLAFGSCHKEAAPRNQVARFTEPRAQIEFLLVKPGEFMTTLPPEGKEEQVSPLHHKEVIVRGETIRTEYVFLGKQMIGDAFYMSATEVTNEQFSTFCQSTGYSPRPGTAVDALDMPFLARMKDERFKAFAGPKQPVVCVNESDVQAFCKWLGKGSVYEFRLPSDAEWEYVAYTASTDPFSLGEMEDYLDYAWYKSNSGGVTHDVGMKRPNKWGFYDCLGNASELATTGLVLYMSDGETSRRLPCLAERGGNHANKVELAAGEPWLVPQDERTTGIGFRLVATGR